MSTRIERHCNGILGCLNLGLKPRSAKIEVLAAIVANVLDRDRT
ncbi:hypothetical protein [Stenomitos frigidus]|nr:hypothetical protein [Stenomitos frigidus]